MNQEHEMPARIWIDKSLGMVGYINGPPPPESNFRYEYVRADLLATVRREAFKDAATLCRAQESPEYDIEVIASGWEDCKLHCAEILEASANQKGEMNG